MERHQTKVSKEYIDGVAQYYNNCIPNALELL